MSRIAFFDFDGTLARRDSLLPFLCRVAGFWPCAFVFAKALVGSLATPCGTDKRTWIKERLLFSLLQNRPKASVAEAARAMRTWPRWIEPTVEALRRHHEQGDRVVVSTGSLDLYIHEMLTGLPVDDVLCTRMEVVDGVLTGRMDGGGNCVRVRKAELVAAYMREHGPFTESWAYGNAPHDLPMMELTTNRVIV